MTPNAWLGVTGFAVMLVLIFVRVPIAFAMGIVGVGGIAMITDPSAAVRTLGIIGSSGLVSYGLSVVPLFVLMGVAASNSGMSQGLYRFMNSFLGHRKGGLAMATIGASAMFSAVCGSSLATAATMAKVAMPEMRKHRYDDGLASGVIGAGGALGVLIPPSVILIVYSLLTETPLFALFVAAIIPGILAVVGYIVAIMIIVRLRPGSGPSSERATWHERLKSAKQALPVIVLFTIVLGGIYGGFFTPTEAAAVGAVGGLIYLVWKRGFDRAVLGGVLLETVLTTAMIFMIVIGAEVFSFFLSFSGLPGVFSGAVAALDMPAVVVVLALMVVYLVLGCFMESLGIMTLTVPVVFPLISSMAPELGMTTAEAGVWFGIFIVMAVEIGMLTPPLGLNVFVIKGAVGDIALGTIFRGVLPFWFVDVLRLLLIIFVPALALYLPRIM